MRTTFLPPFFSNRMVVAAYVKPKKRVLKVGRTEKGDEKRLSEKKHRSKVKGGRYNKVWDSDW